MERKYFIPLILSLLVLCSCAPSGAAPTPPSEAEPPAPSGEAEPSPPGEGTELIYQRQTFSSQEEFSNIYADKSRFEEDFTAEFETIAAKYRIN